jgi:hypothetical protein
MELGLKEKRNMKIAFRKFDVNLRNPFGIQLH